MDAAECADPSDRLTGDHRRSIAVVDLDSRHRRYVADTLLSLYPVSAFADGPPALAAFTVAAPSLVVVGEHVGRESGVRFIRLMRRIDPLSQVPIVYVADGDERTSVDAIRAARMAGAATHLVKPYGRTTLIQAIAASLNAEVEHRWESLPSHQCTALKGTIEVFTTMTDLMANGQPPSFDVVGEACRPLIETVKRNEFKSILNSVRDHDNYTYAHSLRVAVLLLLFGTAAGVDGDDLAVLASGGLLHDAGKMSIPLAILNKPGRLDDAEFTIIKSHVAETVRFLRAGGNIPNPVIIIAEQHHEKLDGTGYPNGLKGAQLNELARMAAIVDVFGALTDRRPYKPAMDSEPALRLMADEMGNHHLDLHFLGLFKEMLLDAVG